jgi:hypothetical protein
MERKHGVHDKFQNDVLRLSKRYFERLLVTRLSSAAPQNALIHFGSPQQPINPMHYYVKCIQHEVVVKEKGL